MDRFRRRAEKREADFLPGLGYRVAGRFLRLEVRTITPDGGA
jgi:hypothetical protein